MDKNNTQYRIDSVKNGFTVEDYNYEGRNHIWVFQTWDATLKFLKDNSLTIN